jgi:cytochrome c-type biogenesis protein CcmH
MLRLLFLALILFSAPAFAVQPDERLADPALEARARTISQELRCLVCQNESIDDSGAPLAHDLRVLVRQRLTAGDSDAAVRRYIVARYGDFVLLKPPFRPGTLLLWLTPAIVLAGGGLVAYLGTRRARPAKTALNNAEEEALARILREQE